MCRICSRYLGLEVDGSNCSLFGGQRHGAVILKLRREYSSPYSRSLSGASISS